jgi:hypothetical protein
MDERAKTDSVLNEEIQVKKSNAGNIKSKFIISFVVVIIPTIIIIIFLLAMSYEVNKQEIKIERNNCFYDCRKFAADEKYCAQQCIDSEESKR